MSQDNDSTPKDKIAGHSADALPQSVREMLQHGLAAQATLGTIAEALGVDPQEAPSELVTRVRQTKATVDRLLATRRERDDAFASLTGEHEQLLKAHRALVLAVLEASVLLRAAGPEGSAQLENLRTALMRSPLEFREPGVEVQHDYEVDGGETCSTGCVACARLLEMGRRTCPQCKVPMQLRPHTLTKEVSGLVVVDGPHEALGCPQCGLVMMTLAEGQRYELRAAITALATGPTYGGLVRYARRAMGATRAGLAASLGGGDLDEETVRRWEEGDQAMPRIAELALIALMHAKLLGPIERDETGRYLVPRNVVV